MVKHLASTAKLIWMERLIVFWATKASRKILLDIRLSRRLGYQLANHIV